MRTISLTPERPKMHSFAIGSNYKAIEGPTWIPYPQAKCKEPGRPRGTRMQGEMDVAETVSGLRRCRMCNETKHDHNRCMSESNYMFLKRLRC
jgi:hypothetical protein